MTMTDSLDGLIERVERCTGPDREIDAEISAMLLGNYIKREPSPRHWRHAPEHSGPYTRLPAYTASIDVALAFVERKLPGWEWRISGPSRAQEQYCIGRLFFPQTQAGQHGIEHRAEAKTPALAIILATLRALQSIKTSETPDK